MKGFSRPLKSSERHSQHIQSSNAGTGTDELNMPGGLLIEKTCPPEAADVAGVGPEEVDPVLCTRVLNIIALLCSLHDMPQMTPPC